MNADPNPYEPPQHDSPIERKHPPKYFAPLAAPAIGILFCGAFWLAPLLLFFVAVSQAKIEPPRGFTHEYIESFDRWWPFWMASFLSSCAMIFGASQMGRKQNYPASMTGAIAAILPLNPCFCLTAPLGIWALVVLLRKETRAAFAEPIQLS